ncbi:MAG TPA: lytic murein transglycosylase [Candidatus Paceibacterota bacterium]|nr:lytic murein transglycosylase [Candidatus Paceibacterota bacterium]
MKKITPFILIFSLLWTAVGPAFTVQAQLDPEKEKQLRAELEVIEREIKEQQGILASKQLEGASIARDVAILNAQIKQAQLKIQKHNLAIERLGKDIVIKSNVISGLEKEITKGQESLAQIIRKTHQLEDYSLPELVLGGTNLSESLVDLDAFTSIKGALADTFVELRDAKKANEDEKVNLGKKKSQEIDTRVNVEAEKKKIESAEAEKKRLLALNKNEQAGYQKVIADKAAKAAAIRTALFGLRDSAAIPFGTALEYAKKASAQTGVRPAFVLAILTQESNLGANVGSCYMTDTTTGSGIKVSTGLPVDRVMKPERDIAPFLEITKEVGRDYLTTRVSCPLSVGYGGAMGPAQFIPSTWQLFKKRIAALLGVTTADPWNPEHAFMASALYLADLGAVSGSYTAERNAACKYYSGRVCAGPINTPYGDQVMAKAATIQSNIDFLNSQ